MKQSISNYAVELKNVSKIYKLKRKDGDASKRNERFYALKDISFKIEKGDVVGILGTNGSGKSTLSVILAGISEIDSGDMKIYGEQALVAVNTGLNEQLTGLENINVKGALLGLNKKRIREITDDVIDFAELGDFLYQPVKKYSSGMKSRLGFSISLALDPEIFIVDEALSVGDKGFAQKCMNRMKALRDEKGKTIFFISHALPQVRDFCKTGMWIEGGKLKEMGDINTVCDHYADYVDRLNSLSNKEKKAENEAKFAERIIKITKKESFIDRMMHAMKG
ncbi:ABC transporter ATP-binding protein [[Clostridium] innocuum]|nr:ABC transporter ATP-binding protein [[Clostridium] innocuum]